MPVRLTPIEGLSKREEDGGIWNEARWQSADPVLLLEQTAKSVHFCTQGCLSFEEGT